MLRLLPALALRPVFVQIRIPFILASFSFLISSGTLSASTSSIDSDLILSNLHRQSRDHLSCCTEKDPSAATQSGLWYFSLSSHSHQLLHTDLVFHLSLCCLLVIVCVCVSGRVSSSLLLPLDPLGILSSCLFLLVFSVVFVFH
jgi:hypothetical protein